MRPQRSTFLSYTKTPLKYLRFQTLQELTGTFPPWKKKGYNTNVLQPVGTETAVFSSHQRRAATLIPTDPPLHRHEARCDDTLEEI
ncbi:hypothetical protein EYF80_017534 [Liparis tanakae]|uniref:Uncharacterized protein n=1 Tax=Liparis tanakae TaxID=230148 RepID=A0A4Z2I354_9TELE|nr:hypothetical protein EYF80_017534 [Liparis tanakae]